jgi:DNA-binding XRE family transcriptional regulator
VDNIIVDVRRKLNLTQDELAAKLSISRELVNKMENGKADVSYKTKALINELLAKEFVKKNSQRMSVVAEDPIPLERPQMESGENITHETIRDLARSNATIADTVKISVETVNTLALSNRELVEMVKSRYNTNSNEQSKQPRTMAQILAPYIRIMAKAGVPDMWETEDVGIVKLGRLLAADVPVMH